VRDRAWLLRRLLLPVVLPHEVAHLLPLLPWSRSVRIEFDPERRRGGLDLPLARLAGEFSPRAPVWAVRLAAVAPLLAFGGGTVAVDLAVGLGGGVDAWRLALVVLLAAWAAPSDGDVNVLLRARAVRDSGTFDAVGRVHPRARGLSTVATVLVTWVVGIAVLT
jgi:hypothetical protein